MSRKRTYKKRSKVASKIDLTVVILIAISILLTFIIYTKSGIIGVKLTDFLGGMIGTMQYILPIGIFALAIKVSAEGNETLTSMSKAFRLCMCTYVYEKGVKLL